MKKNLLVIIFVVIVLAAACYGYSVLKIKKAAPEKSTKDAVAELFSQKYSRPINAFTVEVTTNTGSFAKGTYNEPGRGGGIWFAAKTAKGWELAIDGNGIAPCDAANKYNFPQDMVPQCIDAQNNLIKR